MIEEFNPEWKIRGQKKSGCGNSDRRSWMMERKKNLYRDGKRKIE